MVDAPWTPEEREFRVTLNAVTRLYEASQVGWTATGENLPYGHILSVKATLAWPPCFHLSMLAATATLQAIPSGIATTAAQAAVTAFRAAHSEISHCLIIGIGTKYGYR